MAVPETIGMKLHSPLRGDGVRIAEFYSARDDDYEIATVDNAKLDRPKINTVHLTKRELKALRHWIDAALGDVR